MSIIESLEKEKIYNIYALVINNQIVNFASWTNDEVILNV